MKTRDERELTRTRYGYTVLNGDDDGHYTDPDLRKACQTRTDTYDSQERRVCIKERDLRGPSGD